MKKNSGAKSAKRRFYLLFILGTAAILLISLATALLLETIFVRTGIITLHTPETEGFFWIIIFGLTSVIIGMLLAYVLSRIIFEPVNKIIDGMERLSEGEFSTRIDLGKYEAMKNVSDSFNKLAKELESTEIMRSDFVNDFTHELKTPIVSISALISLLKNDNLSDDKRRHYLEIMDSEAKRLTEMTTNTLYLSRLETQEILTNKTEFNVSEQMRNAVLLLERKWDKKRISFSIDIPEIIISANEDMLMQVWVNLIDNAIKFAERRSVITITADASDGVFTASVENVGAEIPESDRTLIFNKFYQCDKSRTTEGNGIGLSIVKHIITLHGGKIEVGCREGKTKFTLDIPIEY